MSVKRKDREPEQTIRYQNRIIALLFAVVAGLVVAYWRLPKNLWVYQPPDVSKAFVQKVGDIPLASIYGFSRTLWEALNYCESDCHKEYPERIARYRTYLTDSCYLELENHYQKNQSLYGYRSRTLLPTEKRHFCQQPYPPDVSRQLVCPSGVFAARPCQWRHRAREPDGVPAEDCALQPSD